MRLGTFEEILRGREEEEEEEEDEGKSSVELGRRLGRLQRRRGRVDVVGIPLDGASELRISLFVVRFDLDVSLSDGPESAPTSASSPPIAKSRGSACRPRRGTLSRGRKSAHPPR